MPNEKHWCVFCITTAGAFSACSVRWSLYATRWPLYGKYGMISIFTEKCLVIPESEGIENYCCWPHLCVIYGDSLRAVTMSRCWSLPQFLKLILMKAGIQYGEWFWEANFWYTFATNVRKLDVWHWISLCLSSHRQIFFAAARTKLRLWEHQ